MASVDEGPSLEKTSSASYFKSGSTWAQIISVLAIRPLLWPSCVTIGKRFKRLLFQLIAHISLIAADNNGAALDQFVYKSVELALS